jgi:hypothetical protein
VTLRTSFHCCSFSPSPVGHPLKKRVQKRKTEYGFVEGKNGFNCVSCGTHRGGRAERRLIR